MSAGQKLNVGLDRPYDRSSAAAQRVTGVLSPYRPSSDLATTPRRFSDEREQRLRRYQSSSPPLYRRRGHDCCSRPVRHGWFCGRSNRRDKTKSARNQAGNEHHVRALEADRRWPPECRICRGWARRWPCSSSAARLALRHLQLCRCRPSAGVCRLQGHRPHLRGYGTTRFLSGDTMRNGQQSAVALDAIALMDALKIDKATLAGFDWGARTADIVSALWPERCKALVSVSGYLIGSQEAGKAPLPPTAELQWWYQFYFATERGLVGYDKIRRDFSKPIWRQASPKWDFDDATFDRARRPSTTLTTWPSGSTITAGGSTSPTASGNTTIWKRNSPRGPSSQYPRSLWKGTPTARPIPTRQPTAANSQGDTSTGSSTAASATTCRRRLRKPLPKRSSPRMKHNTRDAASTPPPPSPARFSRRPAPAGKDAGRSTRSSPITDIW